MKYYREFPEINITETVADATKYLQEFTDCFDPRPMRPWWEIDLDHFSEKVPSFKTLFDPLGITPIGIVPVVVWGQTRIHIDPYAKPTTVRLNIPIYNCELSETRFFELLPGRAPTTVAANDKHDIYHDILASDCEMVDTVVLKHVTALAVGRPHQVVVTRTTDVRIALTIPFDQDEVSHFLFGENDATV